MIVLLKMYIFVTKVNYSVCHNEVMLLNIVLLVLLIFTPIGTLVCLIFLCFQIFYLFNFRERRKERERERNISQLALSCPQPGTWPATQSCALTGNQICNPLVHSPELNPLSHTSHGENFFKVKYI